MTEEIRNHTLDTILAFQAAADSPTANLNPYRTGFIARPFGSGPIRFVSDQIQAAFKRHNVRVATYEPGAGGRVISEILSQISSAHFGIADITSSNRNVLLELGAMIAGGKRPIILRDIDDKDALPFSIAGYDCFRYTIRSGRVFILNAASNEEILDVFLGNFIADLQRRDKAFLTAKDYVDS